MNMPCRVVASIALGLSVALGAGASLRADHPPGSLVPTEEEWSQMIVEISEKLTDATAKATAEGQRLNSAVRAAILDEVYARVDFSSLDLETIQTYWPRLAAAPQASAAARTRLKELSSRQNAEGANAAIVLVQTVRRGASATERDEAVSVAFAHPNLDDALRADVSHIGPLAALVTALPEADRDDAIERLLGWATLFNDDLAPAQRIAASAYASALRDLGDSVDAERFQQIRRDLLANVRDGLAKAETDGTPERQIEGLKVAAHRLDSAIMRGEFMGHPAPPMEFTWIHDRSGTPEWKSLDDLKGKVVVLDFWATWCGPCIASFPQVAELRKKYSPDELVIIGVTSIQGSHSPRGAARIDTTGDPTREMALMMEYMEQLDITWTVVFSAEPVFNTDYDVGGIPHLTIIDAEGKVRHNGLHPAMPMDRKAELLDPLIAELRAKSTG